jgi:hypothetical protein
MHNTISLWLASLPLQKQKQTFHSMSATIPRLAMLFQWKNEELSCCMSYGFSAIPKIPTKMFQAIDIETALCYDKSINTTQGDIQ